MSFLPLDTTLRPSGKSVDWDDFLSSGKNLHFIPPVEFFKKAPLADIWKEIAIKGLKIEVPNPFVRCPHPVNWIATIRHYAGYKALVEFECFGVIPQHAAWMSFCSDVPKYLGYSDANRILLFPPHAVRAEYPDFLDKARASVQNCQTVAKNHGELIEKHLKKCQKYDILTMLEVMDRDYCNRMRVATVTGTIGNRIHVTYVIESRKDDLGYWFDVNSDYVHPVGFSQTIGQEIYGVPEDTQFTPLSPDYFPSYPPELILSVGQMLEARHPLKPYLICAATVSQVLKYGYFIAEFRTTQKEHDNPITFLFHVTSPYILPCGFCKEHNIPLVPPHGEDRDTFHWNEHLEKRVAEAASLHLIPPREPHEFEPGMKVEACGIIDPTYLGPATIRQVQGHLLYMSFDGWPSLLDSDTEFWSYAHSTEIYPIGFAEMVGHNFQGRVESNRIGNRQERFRKQTKRGRKPKRKANSE